MKKKEIIKLLNDNNTFNKIINHMDKLLVEETEYNFEQKGDTIIISTSLYPGLNGSYYEATIRSDSKTKEQSLISVKKDYSPQYEIRYSFRQMVGLNIFTQAYNYVFNKNEQLISSSNFTDENKYYGNNNIDILKDDVASIKKYIDDTTPKYIDGYYVENPKSCYAPFVNTWNRYMGTHVYKNSGRSPINGEYSSIGITFDDEKNRDIDLLSESNGQIYKEGRKMKIENADEIIAKLEEIYLSSLTESGIDKDSLYYNLDKELFESYSFGGR